MDISKLTRDVNAVAATLSVLGNDSMVTKSGCFIHVPSRYANKSLAFTSSQGTYILGMFALITPDGKYSVFNFPNMVKILPSESRRFFHDEQEYIEYEFVKGSPVIVDTNVLVQDTLIYNIYDYFIDGGVIPWFMSYEDLVRIPDLIKEYAGVKLGASWSLFKILIGKIARQKEDRAKLVRELYVTRKDIAANPPVYISFSSTLYGPKTTTATLFGPYFDTAIVSRLNNPSTTTDNIEKYLRS